MMLFGRSKPDHDLEEQGFPPQGQHDSTVSAAGTVRQSTLAPTDLSGLIPHADKLLVFRAITGIDTVPALKSTRHSRRPAPNIGIYTRIVAAEKKARRGYRVFSILINFCLGIQVLVAAVLTALGAANGSHKAVTGFGAINTIIAGILTYLKGSGLPDRYKYHENEWKRVREYIEQREREFCLADCSLDVQEELVVVESLYKSVKTQLEGSKNPGQQNSSVPERLSAVRGPLSAAKNALGRRGSASTEPPEKPLSKPSDRVTDKPSVQD